MNNMKTMAGALLVLAVAASYGAPAAAQTAEVKEKPPVYIYVANWAIPRAKWAEMEKSDSATDKLMEKALASGTLVAYASSETVVHENDGYTHGSWWSATSEAGLLNVLDQLSGSASTSAVLASATKHTDMILVTRYYNWKAGSFKRAFGHNSSYTLKADASSDALDTLSKSAFVPVLEKLLAEGSIIEYEIDREAIHTTSPDKLWVYYVTPNAEGLDKVNAALRENQKANPMIGPTLDSMIDFSGHRDGLERLTGALK
jgi:hypothetical protein